MEVKVLELRDAGTFIPVVAMRLSSANEGQRYLLRRAGYDLNNPTIVLMDLNNTNRCENNPYDWATGARTFPIAHKYIAEHFDELADGSVVDVEYILGERATIKESERHTVLFKL